MDDTWALVSDVHGNLSALERALEHARSEGATKVAFLGDALGGSEDEACCRVLMREASVSIFGNRDIRVRLAVSGDAAGWLRSLPATRTLGNVLLCHSSPASAFPLDIRAEEALAFRRGHNYWSLFPYVSGRAPALIAARVLVAQGLSAAFHGHTHRQTIWRVTEGGASPERLRQREVTVSEPALPTGEMRSGAPVPDHRHIIVMGVGSVGKGERDRVEYGLYTPSSGAVRLVSVDGG